MKKKRNSKNRRNFVAIPYNGTLTLGTLADNVVAIAALLSSVLGEDLYIISVDIYVSFRDTTGGEILLIVGLAHGDLTVTEILENLDAELTDPDDIIAKERARRPVRRFGVFNQVGAPEQGLNDGKKIRVPIRFSVGDGFNLNVFVVNRTGAALTTGGFLEFSGTIFGRWQR